MNTTDFIEQYLNDIKFLTSAISKEEILETIYLLKDLRKRNGRLFILGVGGSAANASHAVNDFRKIAKIETYAPTDNVSELTARTNDEGWDTIFVEWLKMSHLNKNDAIMVFSVGGGTATTSQCIVKALEYASNINANILGIVSRDGGFTKQVANSYIIIPTINSDLITPHAEEWQGIIWHLIVNALKEEKNEY